MYEADPYGEEVEEEDKNDGLNALVSLTANELFRIFNT
jgi:hypothetical protein